MRRRDLLAWIGAYERLWRSPGTNGLVDVFTEDVVYSMSPWREPVRGAVALAAFWSAERDVGDTFTLRSEVVAVDGAVGVARVEVDYGSGARWRDLWVVRLADDGRCSAFEEWPFAPRQHDGHE